MHNLIYLISIKQKYVWLRRGLTEHRIGSVVKSGTVRWWSTKVKHLLDEEDGVIVKQAFKSRPDPEQYLDVGSIQIAATSQEGGVSLRVMIHDELSEDILGVWSPRRGLQLTTIAHPALHQDQEALAELCAEAYQGPAGIFSRTENETPTLFNDKRPL